jgi:hypothetical protein
MKLNMIGEMRIWKDDLLFDYQELAALFVL